MLAKTVLLFSLAAYALANPQITSDLTTASFPAGETDLSSVLASISSLESLLSGQPTLPASVQSYLLTAQPTTFTSVTDVCDLASIPNYLATAPAYVKSALTSYDSALISWYEAHSTDFSADTSFTYTGSYTSLFPTGSYSTYFPTGTCAGAVSTGKNSATTKATGSSATVAATNSAGASSTVSGSAASSTGSSAAAATGGVGLSMAGVVGVLGIMVAL